MNQKVAVITGSSSGFGLLTAVEMAAAGYRVLATMRNLERRSLLDEALRQRGAEKNVEVRQLDISHIDTVAPVLRQIAADHGRIDVLVNNAGFALGGFLEDVTIDELRRQFETNFFGQVAATKAVLPFMRQQRSGHIIMVSSISGRCAQPVIGSYSASKWALEGWSEALRIEVQPLGVQVAIVEPGAYETDVWERNAQIGSLAFDPASPNRARAQRFSDHVKKNVKRADAAEVARMILRIANDPHPRLRYVAGTDAKVQLSLKRLLPWRMYERMITKVLQIDRVD